MKLKKLAIVLFALMSLSAFAAESTVKGHLVDLACGREDGKTAGFGEKHSKGCLQMPDCVASGYGVLTADKEVIAFDKAGNEEAKRFIADLKKEKDIKVAVTGNVNGSSMSVSKIELQ